jgi:ribose-phosphate pyrophosphokinase
MKIFSGSSNKPLAEKVAQELKLPLSAMEIFIFPDGERRIQIQEKILDEDTVIIQSSNSPVDDNYMELFFIIDALKRSGARSVTVVMPYLGYQRQDHIFRDGEAVSLDVVVKIIDTLGVDKIIFFDPHTIKLPDFFTIPVANLSALPLFAKIIKERELEIMDRVLVSPDMGGLRRIKILSDLLEGMPWIAANKDRDLNNGKVKINNFEGDLTVNELKGKCALIIDDIISSGKTIVECANLLKSYGIKKTFVFTTHALFAKEALKLLQDSEAEKIYVTDSVLIPEDKRFAKLEILTISEIVANELRR